jgi:hypothetical protein
MSHPPASAAAEQAEVIGFLRDPGAWPTRPSRIDTIETHAAFVFLAGEEVLKIKRAVKLAYLDFSTLEARKRYCERELEINRPHAPAIYRDVVAITRDPGGRLAIGGAGEPVEWAVRMARFGQDRLLSAIVRARGIDRDLALALADMVAAYHRAAPPRFGVNDPMADIVGVIAAAIVACPELGVSAAGERFRSGAARWLASSADIRAERVSTGHVRRCHGDLHLANIVLWEGRPVPFDAIEFDERLATIDTLYDLAFLLMDLERQGARATANTVLNRYLWSTGDASDLSGLRALPLFLATRAAVRAAVAIDRSRVGAETGAEPAGHVLETLALAERFLAPPSPRLVAIGGLSGTGKTTLAAALAPEIGASPGAVHLRTDLERKRLAGVAETERLPASAYTPDEAKKTYDRVLDRARAALGAGHSAIIDAVQARPAERAAVERLARDLGVPFTGLWLEAPAAVLIARVDARTGDASDASAAVVERQLAYDLGEIGWLRIEVGGTPEAAILAARAATFR